MEPPLKKILKVFDQDGLYKTMAIEPSSTAGEICEKFAKKLFLNDSEIVQFSLFIFEGGVRHQLKVTEFPFDYIIKYEKKDYKFYFLNPNGEFISFDKEKQKNNSISSGPPKKELPMPNTGANSGASTSASTSNNNNNSKSSKGMAGWLMRKRPGRYDKVWAVSKGDKTLRLYENEDTDSEPLYDLSLENSIVELKQDLHLVLTLGNSERYTFTSEQESEIVAWANELQATMNYTPGSAKTNIIKNASPMGGMLPMGGAGGFIPSSRDLNVNLKSKAENSGTQLTTIINWVNHILSGKGLKCLEEEVLTGFSDGLLFINLIDDLFQQKLTYRKGKSIYEMQYNIDRCLEVLKEKCKCDYGKIMSSDVTDCKVAKIIVRILWSMFVSFVTNGEKEYAVKEKLLPWCSNIVVEYTNKSIIVDSPSALRNPLCFAAIIAKLHPSVIDYQSIASKKSKEDQAQQIINIAFDNFQIPKIVEPSFWNDDKVDEKSFLIYLSMFYYYLSNQDQNKSNIIKNSINQREQSESDSTISQRDKQLKAIKEQQQINKPSPSFKPPPKVQSTTTTSQDDSTTNITQDEPSKPISQPLKKAVGKPLPLPRKLPPTTEKPAQSTENSTTASTTVSSPSSTTTNTVTINGVTINKPKPPAQISTLKKPAPVPLKPNASARPPSAFVKPKDEEQDKLKQQQQQQEEKERLEQEEKERLEQEEQNRLEEEERLRLEEEEEERLRLEEEERLRLEEEEAEQQRLEQERLEEEEREAERQEQERIKQQQQEKLRQLEREKQEKIKQQQQEKERKEREEKEKQQQQKQQLESGISDILESDAFKLLDDIVTGIDKYTSTPSPSNSQISFPNSYENSNGILNNEEDENDIEQFKNAYEQLQNEEEHYNSFLKLSSSKPTTSSSSTNNNTNNTRLSTNINFAFDDTVVSELDSIIDNLPDASSGDVKARSPDSFSSSAKESSPSSTNGNDDAAPKSPTVTSTKVRKPLPTLTREQEQTRQSIAIKPNDGLVQENNNNQQQLDTTINNDNNNSNNNNNNTTTTTNNTTTTTSPQSPNTSTTPSKEDQLLSPRNTQGRVVVRICLEGFGDVLFCSFAIGYDTLCGKVRDMVIKKMKVQQAEEHEYSLHIVRDGLERVLDDDEILLEAEDKIDRFVFKKNEFDRRLLISNHRPTPK